MTVLIGAYNNAPTLGRAIESILGQTVRDLELIVVDDGSTDATPELARGVADERVRYLPLAHMGIARSLNAGLREARAPFVAVQDADDWSEPDRLERQLEVLENRAEVAVVGCRMHEVDNVYVSDSSFFVSSSAVNPTVTIIANARGWPTRSRRGCGDGGRRRDRCARHAPIVGTSPTPTRRAR